MVGFANPKSARQLRDHGWQLARVDQVPAPQGAAGGQDRCRRPALRRRAAQEGAARGRDRGALEDAPQGEG